MDAKYTALDSSGNFTHTWTKLSLTKAQSGRVTLSKYFLW